MLSPIFWLAFGVVFWLIKSVAEAGQSLDDVRVRRCTAEQQTFADLTESDVLRKVA